MADRDALDVRSAAALVGRHPETVRRWVWTGRLPSRREGNRMIVMREDVQAVAGRRRSPNLAEWARRASAVRGAGSAASAADLVIEDRARRS
jgi:predicted site-specific integrase-resolvase